MSWNSAMLVTSLLKEFTGADDAGVTRGDSGSSALVRPYPLLKIVLPEASSTTTAMPGICCELTACVKMGSSLASIPDWTRICVHSTEHSQT